jgi:aminoglycoside phosphotransferase (APT) family kinase protein
MHMERPTSLGGFPTARACATEVSTVSDIDMSSDRMSIDAQLVGRLIAAQFPRWAGLPIARVECDGWDNSTFHLGAHMKVRLPSAARYVAQVEKEYRWLPRLAPLLPLPIPAPLAVGAPGEGYPWPWAVYRWLDGEPASRDNVADPRRFALDLAGFLVALQRIDAAEGPRAGAHNFYRGGPLRVYDAQTRETLAVLAGEVDVVAATEVWEAALAATWSVPPVWVHGDVSAGNLLVQEGRLRAVIDFGSSGVGDPACDLVIAWTLLEGEGREAFRAALPVDGGTWARGRGWALWKALITLAQCLTTDATEAAGERRIIDYVLAEHRRLTGQGGR